MNKTLKFFFNETTLNNYLSIFGFLLKFRHAAIIIRRKWQELNKCVLVYIYMLHIYINI